MEYPKGGIGWLRGFGVYETLSLFPGGYFQVDPHLDRLRGSLALLRMPMPDPEALRTALRDWAKASGHQWAAVRVVVLEGVDGPWWMIEGAAVPPRPPIEKRGLKAWISDICVPHPPLGAAKTISRVSYELAAVTARENGADDAIMPTTTGLLGESTRASVFFRLGDRLNTPPLSLGILPGVTRSLLVEGLPARGFPVDQEVHPIEDLWQAEEIFVTSTIRGVAPITRLLAADHPPLELPLGPAARAAEEVIRGLALASGALPA